MNRNILLNSNRLLFMPLTMRDLETAAVTLETIRIVELQSPLTAGPTSVYARHNGLFCRYVIHLCDNQSNHNGELIYSVFVLFSTQSFLSSIPDARHLYEFADLIKKNIKDTKILFSLFQDISFGIIFVAFE